MTISILIKNQPIITAINPRLKMTDVGNGTAVLIIAPQTFYRLRDKIRKQGMNPYSVMYWH